MKIQSLKLVYFSPTGTTKSIIESIGKGVNLNHSEIIDITKPQIRQQPIKIKENELLIVGVPVYMGRVPALVNNCLIQISAHKTPVVCVVVYGNRTFGNALLELKDILWQTGCIPVAGGAFIGEHSFSSSEYPVAQSRPDYDDLEYAELFGQKIKQKLQSVSSFENLADIVVPGELPYGGTTKLWSVDFISVSEKCSGKGICAEVCPAGAIKFENTRNIDKEKCISCCACIKNCPEQARTIKESLVKEAAIRLNSLYREPKMPEFFY
ncbi:EFR1 family ferrodoxin [Maribellus maritimus]|uniref:EFR1 family ferrodoxin n=1 Tax=Maribellus maritimus TaxID=2870838 RepID=UPI001EEBB969|nr:EFR1 family ferrodoxin [Maribellus maritimus]MCG6189445.1 EFR1 family ferrodoxin [Maribellus maritimus]